jgi:hypothetical protein
MIDMHSGQAKGIGVEGLGGGCRNLVSFGKSSLENLSLSHCSHSMVIVATQFPFLLNMGALVSWICIVGFIVRMSLFEFHFLDFKCKVSDVEWWAFEACICGLDVVKAVFNKLCMFVICSSCCCGC